MEAITSISNDLKSKIISAGQHIGNTPLVELKGFHKNPAVQLFAKKEWLQTGKSVKGRAAYQIIKDAILKGELDEERVLIDASSGNTAIAYASIAKEIGIQVEVVLPGNVSKERVRILESLNSKITYSSPFESTDGAQELVKEIVAKNPDRYFYADQYNNENNWKAHYETTGPELWNQTEGKITHFVTGLGSTGTFSGTAQFLKEQSDSVATFALQPDFALHGLEGWKHLETAIIPGIYKSDLVDQSFRVNTQNAYDHILPFYLQHGDWISPSAAANIAGAIHVANQLEEGLVVTMLPDDGSKYPETISQFTNQINLQS